ncbi:MAG: glycosyltransferase [Opitutaceae bacterium]|nr:glycosyltransferase [Opitutaceae bacterium]
MPAPLLLDLSHTSHTRARTGIQRVTRALRSALGPRACALTHDPFRGTWRELEPWEEANLAADEAAPKRGAHWPLTARMRSRARRFLGRAPAALPGNSGVLVPEVFSPGVARALPALFAAARGPRVALFHDAIALQLPELTPTKTVARFPAYLIELLAFDGIAAVSDDSAAALTDYWRWLGAPHPPPVQAIPLGVDLPSGTPTPDVAADADAGPTVLSVGSIEGRKNHLALLDACERLWAGGSTFTLHLIGLAHPQTGAAALQRIRALQAAGRALRYDGPVTDAALAAAYARCQFTVYPSLHEGFGLPVIESLAHGKPCVCSGRGALGESARGGGCVMLDRVSADAIAEAVGRLLRSPEETAALAATARGRRFRTWSEYTDALVGWMSGLATRAPGAH